MNAFHMIGLTQAFLEGRRGDLGGSQLTASSAGLMKTMPKPKPRWTIASALASCSVRTASLMSWAVCAIAASATMRNTFAATWQFADSSDNFRRQVLLDQDPDLAEAAFGDEIGQEYRSSVIDPCGKANVHSPPVVGPGDAMAGTLTVPRSPRGSERSCPVMCGPNTARQPSSTSSP